MTDTTTPFASMADVKKANEERGNSWFSADTMKAFDSKVETQLYRGHWFITSEKQFDDNLPRRYSVRYAEDDGDITTVGHFQQHDSIDDALAVMWADINSR